MSIRGSLVTGKWTRRCWFKSNSSSMHYNDVIMRAMASQITSLKIGYSTVYSRRRSKKTSKLRATGLCQGNSPVTSEFPAQRASNAENVSILWRHHHRARMTPYGASHRRSHWFKIMVWTFWHQAITWDNADGLSIGPWGTNSMVYQSKFRIFFRKIKSFQNAKYRPVC